MKPPRIPHKPARIRLYPAKQRAMVLILRIVSRKVSQILRWNTITDEIEPGSWFYGMIHQVDFSFHGQWIAYAARGSAGKEWTGVSAAPFLKTIVESPTSAPWIREGAYWNGPKTVVSTAWETRHEPVPFQTQTFEDCDACIDKDFAKRRDGWESTQEPDTWVQRYRSKGPALRATRQTSMAFITLDKYRYELEGHPAVLDEDVDSAAWDYKGNLIFSRLGAVHRMLPANITSGIVNTTIDLETYLPPNRSEPTR